MNHDSDVTPNIDDTLDAIEESSILDQKPGEPEAWYRRRVDYILNRNSVRQTYIAETEANGETPSRPHPGWYENARVWGWEADKLAYARELIQEQALNRAARVERIMTDNQDALDYAMQICRAAIAKSKAGSGDQRLWIETLSKLTAERRRDAGYDRQIIEQAEPQIKVTIPGVSDDRI